MGRNEKNVVILMYKFSVVVKGIEKMLTDLGYTVDILSEDLKILFVILVEIECVKTVNSGETSEKEAAE